LQLGSGLCAGVMPASLTLSSRLVNNLATSFAQHPSHYRLEGPLGKAFEEPPDTTPAQRRILYLDAARRWATNANQHASATKGDRRTDECDQACAVSLCNLGDIASMSGNLKEARRFFEKAIATSKSVGFEPGVTQAERGLKSLSGNEEPKFT
jgi:hypothetical protein